MDKLAHLTDRGMTEVKIVLLTGAKNHLGISNLPNETDLKQICDFLKSNYGDFTAGEIDHAIQQYARGAIGVNSKAYGVLSTMFLSDLLNEYRLLRKQWRDFERRKTENQLLLAQPPKDEAAANKALTEWLVDWVIQTDEIPATYNWDGVFKHLEDTGEIALTAEDKIDFMNIQVAEMQESIDFYRNVNGKRAEMMELLNILNDPKSLKSYCRRKMVHHYLENKLTSNKTPNGNSRKNKEKVRQARLEQLDTDGDDTRQEPTAE